MTSKKSILGAQKRDNGTYRSAIVINGVRHHLGTFKTAEEAGAAYQKAKLNIKDFIKVEHEPNQHARQKREAKEYSRKMLESIDLSRVPQRLKPLYAQYIADLAAGEYSAMRVVIGGNRAI